MQTTTCQTFRVSHVQVASGPLDEVPYRKAVEAIAATSNIESCPALLHTKLVPCAYQGLMACVSQAFDDHRPLSLSPDHVWLLICQGLAMHINANAESLRKRLVSFEGKQKITVRRDDFVKGTMENPWDEVLAEFGHALRDHLGETAAVFAPSFTTTGTAEIAACHITLMDAVQSYFDYELMTMCGIPSVTLEGTPQDWQAIRQRAEQLGAFECTWWTRHLLPVLDQFAAAANGQVDEQWWQSFFKQNDNSGGPYITGHIVNFFPYVVERRSELTSAGRTRCAAQAILKRNPFLGRQPPLTKRELDCNMSGLTTSILPSGLSKAPFAWDYLGTRSDMEFIAGFVGIRQDASTLVIRPEIGWAVMAKDNMPNTKRQESEASAPARPSDRRPWWKGLLWALGRR